MTHLSYAQRRMWFINRFEGPSSTYNIPLLLRCRGRLDTGALRAAFKDVMVRHEVLRTIFGEVDGQPFQRVLDPGDIELPWKDWGRVSPDHVPGVIASVASSWFDLSTDLPLRGCALQVSDEEYLVVLVIHHIAGDGGSLAPLGRDVSTAYRARLTGTAPDWSQLPVQYSDYALWQQEMLGDEDHPESVVSFQSAYWREELAGVSKPLTLPLDRPRPEMASYKGGSVPVGLSADLLGKVKELAHRSGATTAMVLQAALVVLLHRLGGDKDITVGSPIAGRTEEDLNDLVGFFVNTWSLRVQLTADQSFESVLEQVRKKALAAYDHQDVPFEHLVELLRPERSTSYHPLFQVVLAWQNNIPPHLDLPGLAVTMEPLPTGSAKFDLFFNLAPEEASGAAVGEIEYATDLFDRSTVIQIANRFVALVEEAVGDSSLTIGTADNAECGQRQGVIDTAERRKILVEWNDTAHAFACPGSVHLLFEEQAARRPEAIALRWAEGTMTYGELNRWSNRIAWNLKERGVGPETIVGVSVPRGPAMVAAVLGVLKSDGAYLPLEPTLPAERVSGMLADTGCSVVLAPKDADRCPLPEGIELVELHNNDLPGNDYNPVSVAGADNTAYIIFTSGSTGRPKGVAVAHRTVHNLLNWCYRTFHFGADDVVLCVTSLGFDLSVFDIFGLLGCGGGVYIANAVQQRDPRLLLEVLLTQPITFWDSVPTTLNQVASVLTSDREYEGAEDLRLVFLSGDFTPLSLPDEVRRVFTAADIVSLGGATEATVWSNYFRVGEIDPSWQSIPYGRPIDNARYYVLDEHLEPCSVGVGGDLYIGGDCLSIGYVNRPELNAERFIRDPFSENPCDRLYCTGDRASFYPDGNLCFLGRADNQAKLRGFRVEPGEIEYTLAQHPSVRQSIVTAREDQPGDVRLVAYVVPTVGALSFTDSVEGKSDASGIDEQVKEWQEVYDQAYAHDEGDEFGEDFTGWNNSYTGEPIPLDEMRDWRDAAVDRVMCWAPERVLELGAGTGLLLAHIASQVKEYWATDLSSAVIDRLGWQVSQAGLDDRVVLRSQAADDFTGLPHGAFDTVLINSVVQYFPDEQYLAKVLHAAWDTLAPAGRIVLGDIRRASSLRILQAGVQRSKYPDAPEAVLRTTVEQAVLLEKELVVDPEWFLRWAREVGAVGVDIRIKDGAYNNELIRHRYEVVIQKASTGQVQGPRESDRIPTLAWEGDLSRLKDLVRERSEPAVRIEGIPNARLAEEAALARRLGVDASPAPERPSLDPSEVRSWATENGWDVISTWSAHGVDLLDVIVLRDGSSAESAFTGTYVQTDDGRAVVNRPVAAAAVTSLSTTLRGQLRKSLPDYMIPSAFVPIAAVPLTENGKPDRRALPVPDYAAGGGRAPATPEEESLCELFAVVLGLDQVGVDDNFFSIGGHSLLATRLVSRIRAQYGVEIPIRVVFQSPTVAELANRLTTSHQVRAPLTPRDRPERPPLSPAQQRLWFIDRFEGPSATYNIALALRMRGDLDSVALRSAVDDVVARHEALRTVFGEAEGQPYQRILDPIAVDVPWEEREVTEDELPNVLRAEARRPFDLAAEIPFRSWLMRISEQEAVLLIGAHHIAADGWSGLPLAQDLTIAYDARRAGRAPEWEPLPVQYADYALWQQELLGDSDTPGSLCTRQLDYWTNQLAGLPESVTAPTDRARPAVASYVGNTVPLKLDPELTEGVRRLARDAGATVSMVLQAALAALLTRLGAGTDVPIGSPIAGRTDEALSRLVGFFVNTWVLRADTSGNPSFKELLGQVRENSLAAYDHQDIPFEHLVEVLNPVRSPAHHPLFQICLAIQNNARPDFHLADLTVSEEPLFLGTARFDLFISVAERDEEGVAYIEGFAEYATELFDESTVTTLLDRWFRFLRQVVAAPNNSIGSIEILADQESDRLRNWSDGGRDERFYGGSLTERFGAVVASTPDAVALASANSTRTWSYAELDRWANRLGHHFQTLGARPNSRVVLVLERSPLLVAAILGVLKTGATYVPLDPTYSPERLEFVLSDLEPAVIVDQGLAAEELGGLPDTPPMAKHVSEDAVAYVIYTSGSTGRPKGVEVTHRNVVDLALDNSFRTTAHRRVLVHSPHTFDASTYELWVPLLGGGTAVVVNAGTPDPAELARVITEQEVTALWLTAGLFSVMVEQEAECFCAVKELWAGGDVLSPKAVRTVLNACPGLTVVNGYGPTETTTFASSYRMTSADECLDPLPIGVPMNGSRLLVLDDRLKPVPPGVVGELYIGGEALAQGYVDRPALTASRFVADPAGPAGSRAYRTGDLARWDTEGRLHYITRRDDQIKVRGFRVEPGELEAVLREQEEVANAVVAVRQDPLGERRMVAYVAPDSSVTTDRDTLEQLDDWREIYDAMYDEAEADAGSIGEDFTGWNSSYTGLPIPLQEMRSWRNSVLRRVRSLRPRKVLEVGVGSGLLLWPLAQEAQEYWGTDFSAPVIDRLRVQVKADRRLSNKVTLRCQSADDADGLPASYFDTVILNSVVQYFPDADYLNQVLNLAMDRLMPGGRIILGDIRNYRTLRAFASAVHRCQHPDHDPAAVQAAVEYAVLGEKELLVDPGFFTRWADTRSDVGATDIRLKMGAYHNELTRHRYEVVLHKVPVRPLTISDLPEVVWGREIQELADLEATLARHGGKLRLVRIPNARLIGEAVEWGARVELGDSLDPDELEAWGTERGLAVYCTWSAQAGRYFEAAIVPDVDPVCCDGIYCPDGSSSGRLTNMPAVSRRAARLPSLLRERLAERLPEFMMPAAIVVLDRLPLTENGKVDRAALPEPNPVDGERRSPRTPREEDLVALFAEVLGQDRVGIDDDFFACGGHSLRLTRLVWRIHEKLGIDIPIRTVYQYPTVAELAAKLSDDADSDFEDPFAVVLPIRQEGHKAPVWWLPPGGGLSWPYLGFARHLDPERPLYGLQARGFDGTTPLTDSVEEMIDDYLRMVLQVQPDGPFHLVGWSLGGTLAHAMAAELQRRGHEVAFLGLLDAAPSSHFADMEALDEAMVREFLASYMGHLAGMEEYPSLVATATSIFVKQMDQMRRFNSPKFRGDIVFFNALLDPETREKRVLEEELDTLWQKRVDGRVQRIDVACAHNEMYWPRNAAEISRVINRVLRDAR